MADDNKDNSSAEPKAEVKGDKGELPVVESPPLSPAGGEPQVALEPKVEPKVEPAVSPADGGEAKPLPAAARFHLRPRHKRQAVLAASVTIAACIGAIVGALAVSGMSAPPPEASRQRQAMEQSIGQLNKEIASLKASVEAGNKSARSQIAKISDKISDKISERSNHPLETTGSIPLPPASVPTPSPRPPLRPEVVRDWSIHDVRDGYVYVRGHGDIYQVVPGAPLPGLGPVREIKREAGRWIVVTPKGLIVSLRDRRHFEPN